MRRLLMWMVLAFLASAAFWATYNFLESPRYSLYQIGKAIYDREPRLFLAYVDVDGIIRGQKDDLVDAFMPREQGNQDTRAAVKGLLGAMMQPLGEQARARVAQVVADPTRDNIPHSWTLMLAASIMRNGDYALVTLNNPVDGERLRLGMRRLEGTWKVVEVDPRDLRRLILKAMEGHKGVTVRGSLPGESQP